MKEFIKALKCVLLSQLLCWGIFILCDENKFVSRTTAEHIAMIVGPILLIMVLILYFVFKNKLIQKNKLNSKKFNIFLFIIWIIFTILIYFVLEFLVGEYLHICDGYSWTCFLNGIEYLLYAVLVFLFPILTLIISLIIKLFKFIKTK